MVWKKYIEPGMGKVSLRSISPDWPDRVVEADEIDAIWPVIGSYRREKGRRF